jgi:cytochrome c peroxidase
MFSRLTSAFGRVPQIARAVNTSATASQFTNKAKFVLAAGAIAGTSIAHSASGPDYAAICSQIESIIDDENTYNPSQDNAPGCLAGGGDIAPVLIRLAWHCAGTWDKDAKNGGSDGATMRFSPEADHGGNAGLSYARNMLEPIKAAHPDISYADLYIFAGKVAIESCGGPEIGFTAGRTDAPAPSCPSADSRFSPDGRLPDGDKGAQHIRDIFYRMGFNDQEIVALSGAHALGRCHTDRSGFWGPWTYSPSTLSNEYFRLLIDEKWTPKRDHNGMPWNFDSQPQYENSNKQLMMLKTDLALVEDPIFKAWVLKYKADEELFFADFSKAWQKLTELGCNFGSSGSSSYTGSTTTVFAGALGVAAVKTLLSK